MTAALRLGVPELSDLPELLARRDLTVDDLAHLPEDLHYELIDGRLVLTPSALPVHQLICHRAAHACEVNQPPDVVISCDQSVRINGHNERRPDLVAICIEGAGVTPVLAADVLLAVEVLSVSSTSVDWEEKRKVYADSGIPRYWIIDPLAERVTLTELVLSANGTYRQTFQTNGFLKLDSPWEITLDLPAWTERRDLIRQSRRTQ